MNLKSLLSLLLFISLSLLPVSQAISTDDTIKANNNNIHEIVQQEIKGLGNHADLNHIDTSRVKSMKALFKGSKFNGDISKWDVSNVKKTAEMFHKSKFRS